LNLKKITLQNLFLLFPKKYQLVNKMKKLTLILNPLLISIFCILMISCSKENKMPSKKYQPVIAESRILDSLITVDLDNDGIDEYIVLTKEKNIDSTLNFFKFDVMDIIAWNPSKNDYTSQFSDTVYFGSRISFSDKNPDYHKIIAINTFSGGEDSVLSSGLYLYGYSKGAVARVFSKETGSPVLINLDSDSIPEIIELNTVFFKTSAQKPIHYKRSIFKYFNGKYIDNTLNVKNHFYDENNLLFKKYSEFKKGNSLSIEGFETLLKLCLNYTAINDYSACDALYRSEKEFLKKVDEKKYYDFLRILFENGYDCKTEIDSICTMIFNKSKILISKNDFSKAEIELNQMLDLDPDFVSAYLLLGEISNHKKEYDESISFFQQASIFTADDKRIYIGLGKAYLGKGQIKESKENFERFLEMDSLSNDAVFVKSVLSGKEFK